MQWKVIFVFLAMVMGVCCGYKNILCETSAPHLCGWKTHNIDKWSKYELFPTAEIESKGVYGAEKNYAFSAKGTSTIKILPLPGVLSTLIFPLCASITVFT